ncbi:NAD(P)/FAD-dependent oxidoreductase [Coprothermobacter platensis]|uniref:NAD(P)/FAD-dependent oxidoreductase n=1 Tax=Coprothermobacter platensis TaxID=108819 RepID=UPI000374F2F0|nr:NAD(P)/FAD-dependent oxidoreductase [Coprothermobacter platensis]
MAPSGTKVVIIGAGFSGLTVAYFLRDKARVYLVDRKTHLWNASTGLITPPTLELMKRVFSFDPPVEKAFDSMNVMFKDIGNVYLHDDKPFLYLLDKTAFFQQLQDKLGDNVEQILGYSFKDVESQNVILERKTDQKRIPYDFLIGADGCFSKVARATGLSLVKSWLYGYEWGTEPTQGNNTISFVIDPNIARAYGVWAFTSSNETRIGLASDRPLRKSDAEQIGRTYFSTQSQPSDFKGGVIPTSGPIRRLFIDNVFLVGDAAGLCGPFLGDGIQTAIKSGMAAAQAIDQRNAGDAYVQFLKDSGVIKYLKQQAILRSIWDRFVSHTTLKRLYRFTLRNQGHLLDDLTMIKEDPSKFPLLVRKFFS